jgi:hypothetical protein
MERLRKFDFRDQAMVLAKLLERQDPKRTIGSEIGQRFNTSKSSLTHALLASLPTTEAVTTNYDRLFEVAATATDGSISVLPYEAATHGSRWLLKLHGSVERDDSIVLTRNDYLSTPVRHGALFGLVQAMLMTRHMLFAGYSLSDEDFHQLVHEVRAARMEIPNAPYLGSALTLFEDPIFSTLWKDDLHIVPMAAIAPTRTDRQIAEAARTQQIFLDLVAFEAADLTAFVLDDTYAGMLTPAELSLRDALQPLVKAATEDPDDPTWAAVRRLLARSGLGT